MRISVVQYSVMFIRGNGVTRRTQKVIHAIQGDDNGHVVLASVCVSLFYYVIDTGSIRPRCVCVSLFYVIDTGSIGSRARIEMGVTYLPFALAQTLAMPIYP